MQTIETIPQLSLLNEYGVMAGPPIISHITSTTQILKMHKYLSGVLTFFFFAEQFACLLNVLAFIVNGFQRPLHPLQTPFSSFWNHNNYVATLRRLNSIFSVH